jgi:hypothetical protein
MGHDEKTARDGVSSKPELPEGSRDATDEVGGWTFVGGFPPWLIDKLKASATHEPEEPGDDLGTADGPVKPPRA